VPGEHVELDEALRVEELGDALARGELAASVLTLDGRLAPRVERLRSHLGELGEALLDGVRSLGIFEGHAPKRSGGDYSLG